MKDLIYLEGAEGMEKLASYAVARNLIPFFGAGTGIYEKSTH